MLPRAYEQATDWRKKIPSLINIKKIVLLISACKRPRPGLRNPHRGHSSSRGGLYAQIRIFKHQTIFRRDA